MSLYVAGRLTPTNVALVDAFRAFDHPVFLAPLEQVARRARRGDTVLPRLDVLPTLDGVEPGLDRLGELQRRGVLLVNGPGAILAAHDKLMTALKLGRSGVPHPRTIHVDAAPERLPIRLPVVVKPRFGSWGQDVVLCRTEDELRARLRELRTRPWFVRQGALVQELVPPRGYDLRVLVADGVDVLLVRQGGRVYALANRCTHRGGPLHQGRLSDGCVECPWHKSVFRLDDGSVERGPAAYPQRSFDVRVADGEIFVRAR